VEPEWRAPSPLLWRARAVQLGLATLGALLVFGLPIGLSSGGRAGLVVVGIVVIISAAGGLLLRRRYRAWGYAERADDLMVRRGVLVRRLTVVPYGRMQFIDVTAGPIDRLFGLATVVLHTAAAATDARIPGLDRPEADRLRDRLAALGEARAAGL
jgi:membrane protein YdbS with pleckstrin-like domain